MDNLAALLIDEMQQDSLTVNAIESLVDRLDVNNISHVSTLIESFHHLSVSLTILILKNGANDVELIRLFRLVELISRIEEVRVMFGRDANFCAACAFVCRDYRFVEACPWMYTRFRLVQPLEHEKIVAHCAGIRTSEALMLALDFVEQCSDAVKRQLLESAINSMDSADTPLLLAIMCVLIKCKDVNESQVLTGEYVVKLFRLAVNDLSPSAVTFIECVFKDYEIDEKSCLLLLSKISDLSKSIDREAFFIACRLFEGFLNVPQCSKYSREIEELLEKLSKWCHGAGLESLQFARLVKKSPSCPVWIKEEVILSCLDAEKNELLFRVGEDLFTRKLSIAVDFIAESVPPFKTLALMMTKNTASDQYRLSQLINSFCTQYSAIHYPEDFAKYKDCFEKCWRETLHGCSGCESDMVKYELGALSCYSLRLVNEHEKANRQFMIANEQLTKSRQERLELLRLHEDQVTFINDLETRLSETRTALAQSDLEKQQLKAAQISYQEQLDTLKCQLEEEKTYREGSNRQYEASINQLNDRIKQLEHQAHASLESLKLEQANNQEERRKLAVQFSEFKKRTHIEKEDLHIQVGVGELKLKQLQADLANLKQQNDSMESMIKEYQGRMHALEGELEVKNAQLKRRDDTKNGTNCNNNTKPHEEMLELFELISAEDFDSKENSILNL